MAPKPKDVLPLAQEITRLEAQLTEAKRKWNLLFGVVETEKKTRSSSPDGLTAKIVNYIAESAGTISTIHAVAQVVQEDELAVGRTLYRLAKAGKIDNPGRGKYCAKEKEAPIEEAS
jgi:hypothetical protein